MRKARYVVSLILDILIVLCVVWVALNTYMGWVPNPNVTNPSYAVGSWHVPFKFVQFDLAIGIGLVSLIKMVSDAWSLNHKNHLNGRPTPKAIGVFALLGAVAAAMAIIYALGLNTTILKEGSEANWAAILHVSGPLFVGIIIPVLTLVKFLGFDLEPELRLRTIWFGLLIGAGWVAVASLFFWLRPDNTAERQWYMFNFGGIAWWVILIWFAGWILSGLLLALILLAIRNAARKRALKPEPVVKKFILKLVKKKEPAPEEEKVEKERPIAAETEVVDNPKAARTYHITKNPEGKWQVRLAGGERAIRLFDTQKEAIIFANRLVKTRGGSIRVHAVNGKIRKE